MSDPFVIQRGILLRYTGQDPVAIIPDGVRKIDRQAFFGHPTLVRVVMPDSVLVLDYAAFQGCGQLMSVRLSEALEVIGQSVFRDCPALTDVFVPDSVRKIGGGAFFGCTGLRSISISAGLPTLVGWAFWQCEAIEQVTIRGKSCRTTRDMLARLADDLHSCRALRAVHTDDDLPLPTEFLPQAIAAWAEDGVRLGPDQESRFMSYLKSHLSDMAIPAARSPQLLALLCRCRMIPARLVDRYAAAAEQYGSLQSISLLLEYRTSAPMAKALAQAEERRQKQADAIIDRAFSRLGQPGIRGLTIITAGKLPSRAEFHDRATLTKWLNSYGARLSGDVSSRVDYVVSDNPLPPGRKAAAEALGIPVLAWEDLVTMARSSDPQP